MVNNKYNEKLKKYISKLENCIENKSSLCNIETYDGEFRKFRKSLKKNVDSSEHNIDKKLFNKFMNLYEEVLKINTRTNKKSENLDSDESYDKRSLSWVERDSEGKILKYKFKILVRDEQPFIGEISKEQMEKIYQYYPYVTRNTISQEFPYFTYIQFKRVLRVFNITKDKLFPQHILEEHTEQEIAEFALKAKESSAYKKYVEHKGAFLENKLFETQKQLHLINEEKSWISNLVDFILREKEAVNLDYNKIDDKYNFDYSDTVFALFSDIHFGKMFKINSPLYRGNSKEILRQRMMRIAVETVKELKIKNKKSITLVCIGDILESILPDGMHPQHVFEMDIHGHHQVLYALDSFEGMINYILNSTSEDIKIKLLGIGGNHDRIGLKRDEDKRRSASALIYAMLDKYIYRNNERVSISNPDDEIIKESFGTLSLIGFHGDSSLSKRTALELINTFKVGDASNFNLILQGHWHSMKADIGMNYLYLTLPSVCSTDNFIKNELGKGAQPAFIIGEESPEGYGFDYKYITLY